MPTRRMSKSKLIKKGASFKQFKAGKGKKFSTAQITNRGKLLQVFVLPKKLPKRKKRK